MNIIDDLKSIDLKNIDLKSIDLKNTRTQILLLTILAALAAAALYIYFVFVPQVMRAFELTASTGKTKSELKSARTVIKDFERLKDELEEQSQKVESYEKKLPAEQEIPALLENLSNMAKESNIKIIGIVPAMSYSKEDKSADKNQIYREIPILITAKSGYHELGNFLNNLENADRFMKAADISIEANKASPKKHDVELLVCTYVLLPENK
ncbi:MAG: type 4a pilus biogenesis protein PilO [Candidatus Omnitrophota bacterium]|nr:type 4a pilus biogenesis protein PilO [Candidatus Omnitrophota bacterium]